MTPEGKVKTWARGQFNVLFPGHWRIAPRGGPYGKAGAPDDIMCWHGAFIAIEIKAEGGVLSALQLSALKSIQKAGGVAAVLRGKDYTRLLAIRQEVMTRWPSLFSSTAGQLPSTAAPSITSGLPPIS